MCYHADQKSNPTKKIFDMGAAFINTVGFPTTLEEFEDYVFNTGVCCDVELLLRNTTDSVFSWTCLKSAKIGDFCYFYQTKRALTHARRLKREFDKTSGMYSSEDRADLLAAFETADGIYNLCGGRIFATGRVKSEPEYVDVEEESHFRGGKFFVDIGDIHVLKNPIPLENFNDFIRIAQRSVTPLSSNQAGKLAELINSKKEENDCDDLESVVETFGKEGKKQQYYATRYERDPKIRKAAIKAHKTKHGALPCHVCGFDYEKTYGEHGRGFIEVHHIKPLSSKDEEVEVNPETDLVCLCANCHRMIHRSGILTPNELIFLFSGNTRCRG